MLWMRGCVQHCSEGLGSISKSPYEQENFLGDLRLEDGDRVKEPFCQFSLPEDEFGEMMFAKRLAPEGSFSPPSLQGQPSGESDVGTRRQSTIDDTDG